MPEGTGAMIAAGRPEMLYDAVISAPDLNPQVIQLLLDSGADVFIVCPGSPRSKRWELGNESIFGLLSWSMTSDRSSPKLQN